MQADFQRLFNVKTIQIEMIRDRGYDVTPDVAITKMSVNEFFQTITRDADRQKTPINNVLSNVYVKVDPNSILVHSILVYYGPIGQAPVGIDIAEAFLARIIQRKVTRAILIVDAAVITADTKRRKKEKKTQTLERNQAAAKLAGKLPAFQAEQERKRKLKEERKLIQPPKNKRLSQALTSDARKAIINFERRNPAFRIEVMFYHELTYNPIYHVDVPHHELLSDDEKTQKLLEMKVDPTKLLIIKLDDPVVRYYGWPVGGVVQIYRDDIAISILSPKSINYRIIVD